MVNIAEHYSRWIGVENDAGNLVCCDDGFWMWFPEGNKGGMTEGSLRAMADCLEERNRPWQEQIDAYFSEQEQLKLPLEDYVPNPDNKSLVL